MRKKQEIKCTKCGDTFMAVRNDAKSCKKCNRKRIFEWQTSLHGRERRKIKLKEHRMLVINAYGGKCNCCGEDKYEFLAIDHVNGGGKKEREKMSSYQIMRKVIKEHIAKIKAK
jgi:formylmethanofuran dehydrogenase subunit E